jgi:hypothetical protein
MPQHPEPAGRPAGVVTFQDLRLAPLPLQAFLQFYYQLFEGNRTALAPLYQDASMLTFVGDAWFWHKSCSQHSLNL